MLPSILRADLRWLFSGFLLMLFSGFGQTYYIALFAGHIKTSVVLSDGEFGVLYTIGTLSSAAALAWAGKFADTLTVRWLGASVIAGLAFVSTAMYFVTSAFALALVFFGLRFFGQGMCTHVAMTAMGRWFNRKRGQAVSIAGLGLPVSEGLLPLFAVGAISLLGWREAWLASALLLLTIGLPVFIAVLKFERHPTRGPIIAEAGPHDSERHHWTRAEVLGNPLFYLLLPITLATPFIITAIFINQVPLSDIKDWDLSWFAASFPLLAGAHVIAALGSGRLVDRIGARRLLGWYLLPLAVGILLLVYVDSPVVLPVLMTIVGINLGMASTTNGALWAELYGVDHLGAVRSIVTALTVFATAVSPGLVGILMDAGVALLQQLLTMAAYCIGVSLLAFFLRPGLDRLAAS